MNALPLDQRAHEDSTKFFRLRSGGSKTHHVHAALMTEKFFLRDASREKGFLRLFAEHEDEIGEIVFFEHLVPRDEQPLLPSRPSAQRSGFAFAFRQAQRLVFSFVPVPRRDFDERRNTTRLSHSQCAHALSAPAVKKRPFSACEPSRCYSI